MKFKERPPSFLSAPRVGLNVYAGPPSHHLVYHRCEGRFHCIVEEPDRDGRMVCAVRADLCIGCGLCVTLGNPTAPQQREFGCPADYDAINMMPFEEVVKLLQDAGAVQATG